MTLVVAPPRSPFKGLAAFEDSELDALFFFGREGERDVLVANLLASRLTILYSESGVGKSSLLRAAVVRELREQAPGAVVSLHDTWSGSPAGILDEVADAGEGYLILDQFEEYFLYHGDDTGAGTLLQELPELLRGSRVNVLLALREDALARLDALKARIPNVFANQVRLEHLDRAAARAAVLGPVGRWNELTDDAVDVEPALVDAVLDEVAVEGRSQDRDRIEAPYLQLVLERLWETERAAGSRLLHLATLLELGGAKTIVRDHLLRALAGLADEQQDVAASMFEHLVTPSGTKIAHRAPDLAQYADVPEEALRSVLTRLSHDRIVHAVDGSDRYEIFHDVLAQPIRDWRQQRHLERERAVARRRQRRLVAVTAASLVALALVAGLAAWALSERGSARAQTRHAHARELAASAVAALGVDAQQALSLALHAARLDPNTQSEDALRQALLAARLRRLLHVRSPVTFVAFTQGRLVTGSRDGIRIWEARSGRLVRALPEHGPLVAAASDPRGGRVLTADRDGAHVWSVRGGRPLAALPHRRLTAAAFSPDGTLVVTSGGDARVRVWRTRDGRLLHTVRVPAASRLVALSADDRRVVVVVARGKDTQAYLVDARSGRVLRALPQHAVTDAEFSPDGRLVATGSDDGSTYVWRSRDGRRVRLLSDQGGNISDLAFSPDGSLLATASSDGDIRVWRVADGQRSFLFTMHTAPTRHVAFNATGTQLVSTGNDQTARVWQILGIRMGQQVALLTGHSGAVATAAFSPDGTTVMTGSEDGTAGLWDARIEQMLQVAATEGAPVLRARFADGGRRVVDVVGARLVVHGPGRAASSYTVGAGRTALSDDGRLSATAAPDGSVFVRALPDGHVVTNVHPQGRVSALAFRAGGEELATAGADGVVTLWEMPSGTMLERFRVRGPITAVAVAPSGDTVLTAREGGEARLWSSRGKLLHVLAGHPQSITDARFDPTGTRVVTAATGNNRNAVVWDVSTGRPLHVLVGHFGTVTAASFSFDGRWILTAGPITAGIWNAASGQLLFYLRGPTALLTDAEWSPTGYRVVTAARDRTVRTYDCRLCEPAAGLAGLASAQLAAGR